MLKGKRSAVCILLILLSCQMLFAQQNGVDRAKDLFESGKDFYHRGDYKNAIQDFNAVINTYRSSQWVDDALFRMALYHNDIQNSPGKAKEFLQQILTSYADSNSAPEAYFYLGEIILSRSNSQADRIDAQANYERVYRLFPDSAKADDSMMMVAWLDVKSKNFQSAVNRLHLLLNTYPKSDIADQAQFDLATAYYYLGDSTKAMLEYQKVRNRYPDSYYSLKAVDRITLIYRLYFNRAKGRPVYFHDTSFRFKHKSKLDNPVFLQAGNQRELYLVDRGSEKIYRFDPKGNILRTNSTRRPTMAKVDQEGNLFHIYDGRIRKEKQINLRINSSSSSYELKNIKSFALSRETDLYVFDEGRGGLYRFNLSGRLLWEYKNEAFRDLWDMEVNSFGNLFTLNGPQRKLTMYNPENNRRERGLGPTYSGIDLREPICIEIDELDNIYILDRKLKGVFVLDLNGKLIARYYFPNKINEARSLAVDSSGALYLLDRRERTIYRYQ